MDERIIKYVETFKDYVKDYDMSNDKIKLKYDHSLRVMELQKKYATLLGFSEDEIELATLIGLLHDIGRFEQIRVYDSFDDLHTVDHADYSVEQLFKKDEIKRFTDREDWYPIIEFAVKNHNKLEIPTIDDEKCLKHAKLIRDTDKMDIMIAVIGRTKSDDSKISTEVKEAIMNHALINRKYAVTNNDRVAIQFGFAFNVYNDIMLKEYKDNFIKFHESLSKNVELDEIYDEVIKYIDERIDKYDGNRN